MLIAVVTGATGLLDADAVTRTGLLLTAALGAAATLTARVRPAAAASEDGAEEVEEEEPQPTRINDPHTSAIGTGYRPNLTRVLRTEPSVRRSGGLGGPNTEQSITVRSRPGWIRSGRPGLSAAGRAVRNRADRPTLIQVGQAAEVVERSAVPSKKEMPSTLERSAKKAQETWTKTHDAAVAEYGEGERAHRTAFSALKHSFEKVGDHWEPKEDGHKGPSDEQAARTGAAARRGGPTAGGVDTNATKKHLLKLARELDVPGRSRMTKDELVAALQQANDRATAQARKD